MATRGSNLSSNQARSRTRHKETANSVRIEPTVSHHQPQHNADSSNVNVDGPSQSQPEAPSLPTHRLHLIPTSYSEPTNRKSLRLGSFSPTNNAPESRQQHHPQIHTVNQRSCLTSHRTSERKRDLSFGLSISVQRIEPVTTTDTTPKHVID